MKTLALKSEYGSGYGSWVINDCSINDFPIAIKSPLVHQYVDLKTLLSHYAFPYKASGRQFKLVKEICNNPELFALAKFYEF